MTTAGHGCEGPDLMAARVRVPDGVVYRGFPKETVVLNLDTGLYHGLNPTAGRMIETLDRLGSVADAAKALAEAYDRPLEQVQRDLCRLCEGLLERKLLLIESP